MRGSGHVYVRMPGEAGRSSSARIHQVVRGLVAARSPDLLDVIPGYDNLLVEFDPRRTSAAAVRKRVGEMLQAPGDLASATRTVELDTVYDGPDLEDVARPAGLAVEDVVRRHAAVAYFVYAIGFTPGFAFLGDVDPAIRMPRLEKPRKHVPAGSVAIADAQSGVYPTVSPGGWRLLGRTGSSLYDPGRDPAFLLEPGDTVRFVPKTAVPPAASPRPLELLPAEPRLPTFLVRERGLLDLVLDSGRLMAGRFGLARSGPLDAVSARIANALVGNPADAPLLEINLLGPKLEALRDVVVAFTGLGVDPQLGGQPLQPYASTLVPRGSVLSFRPSGFGRSGYLAVAGGLEVSQFMGSAAVDIRGSLGRPLWEGDLLGAAEDVTPRQGFSLTPHRLGDVGPVRLLPGPQYDRGLMRALTERPLRVEHVDRMGMRLSRTSAQGAGIRSEGNPLGAVQLTSDGHPMVLLNDRGTMGGYTKPAIVDSRDLPRLVQARDGTWVRFVAE